MTPPTSVVTGSRSWYESARHARRHLLTLGLVKLRDLPDNIWNADALYVLTDSLAKVRELARIVEAEDWGGEVRVYEEQDQIDTAIGSGRHEHGLLTVWWD